MPAAIPLIVQTAGAYMGIHAGVVAVATLATTVAVGSYERNRAEKKSRDAYNKSLSDRLLTIRSGVSTRKYVLGTARVGGTLLYADTIGTNQIALDMVRAHCANTTNLVGWYIDDEYVAAADFPGTKYGGRKTLYGRASQYFSTGGAKMIVLPDTPVSGSVRAWVVDTEEQISVTVDGNGVSFTLSGAATVEVAYSYMGAASMYGASTTGTSVQSLASWGSNYPSPLWGSTHQAKGTTLTRSLMLWDEDVYQSGAPEISPVLTGIGVARTTDTGTWYPYDPRTSTYSMTGTTNPALLAAWWMTLPREHRGCGIPEDWIDWDSVAAAANVCDELITVKKHDGSGYEQIKRYECNTVLDTSDSPTENLEIILSAMAGKRAFTAGKYRLFAGAFRSATLTITDDMTVGTEPLTVLKATESAPPNTITATISDATKHWQETSPPQVVNASYLLEDGAERAIDIRLPATTDPRQANYLMGVELESRRPALRCTLHVGGVGEDIALLDTVQLDLTNRPQYAGKTFEVLRIRDNWNGTFELTLSEIKATTWALDADRFTPINQPAPPDLSYYWDVAPIENFDVLDGQTSDGIEIAWDLHSQSYVRDSGWIELRYRRLGESAWRLLPQAAGDSTGTTLSLALVTDAAYEFQARAVNRIGATSPWAYEFATVVAASGPSLNFIGEFATPPSVSGLPEGSVYRNSVDKDTYVLRSGAWQLFLEGGEDGAPGTAKMLRLLVTSNVFQVSQTGTGSPASIALTAQGQNLAGSPTFTVTSGTVTGGLLGTGQTRTLNYSAMATDAVTVQVTQDGMSDQVTILKVYDGSSAIASVLTNEAHTIPADYEGDILAGALTDAVTWMKVYRGGSDDTANWSFTKVDSGVTSTLTTSGTDRGKVAITAMPGDSGYVDITATRSTFPTQVKRFVLAKSKQGAVGASGAGAKLLSLAASSQVFQITKTGANNPASITFTATAQNLSGSLSWSITGGTLTGSGSSRTLTFAAMTGESATVTVTQDGQSDSVTVVKMREGQDGANAVVSLLTNEAHTVAADSAGVVTSGLPVSIDMDVYVGLIDDTINWSFTRTNGTGVTSSINNTSGSSSRGQLTVTALSVDSSTVTITATKSGYPTQTKTFTISKSRQGTGGTPGSNGTRGSAHAYLSGYSAWNQTPVDAYFTSTYGGKVTNDMVTVYGTAFSQTRIWTGSSWGVVTQAHDGTMLIDGTVPNSAMTSIASHGMSITPDPGFEDLSLWTITGNVVRWPASTWGKFGRWALLGGTAAGGGARASGSINSRKVPITRGKDYRVACYVTNHEGNRVMILTVTFYDASGNVIPSTSDPAGWPATGPVHLWGLLQQTPVGIEVEYSMPFGPSHTAQIPTAATHFSVGAFLPFDDGVNRSGSVSVSGLRIQQLQDTELLAPNAATEVLAIRTAGYTVGPGGTGGVSIRGSGGIGDPDLAWTNNLGETVDILVRGSASVAVTVSASASRTGAVAIYPHGGGSPLDMQVAVVTPAVNGIYEGSGAPSYATTVAAGATVQFDLRSGVQSPGLRGVGLGDNYSVSDGQLSLEVIKR